MADLTKLQHSSLHNYQQILLNSSDTFSGAKPITFTTNGIPYVRVWNEQIVGEVSVPVIPNTSTVYHDDYQTVPVIDSLTISATSLDITTSASLKVYWRVYSDVSG